jgi:hypothetical protein
VDAATLSVSSGRQAPGLPLELFAEPEEPLLLEEPPEPDELPPPDDTPPSGGPFDPEDPPLPDEPVAPEEPPLPDEPLPPERPPESARGPELGLLPG